MTVVKMNENVDHYLAHHSDFQGDLNRVLSQWETHYVTPISTAYEASEKRVKKLQEIAVGRQKNQQIHLKKIQQTQDIIIGICLVGVDIFTASAASRLINVQRKFSSKQSFESFRNSSDDFETAWLGFTNQSDTWADAMLGNLDSTLRSQLSTGKAKEAIAVGKVYAAQVAKGAAAVTSPTTTGAVFGPVAFNLNMEKYFKSAWQSLDDAFRDQVSRGNGSAEHKRFVVERLVEAPFCRPPVHDLAAFEHDFTTFFEISRYIQMFNSVRKTKGKWGKMDDIGNKFHDALNEQLCALTGHYFTHRGGAIVDAGQKRNLPTGDFTLSQPLRSRGPDSTATGRDRDFQLAWDGTCGTVQSKHAKKIMAMARELYFDPFVTAVGVSAQNHYLPKAKAQ